MIYSESEMARQNTHKENEGGSQRDTSYTHLTQGRTQGNDDSQNNSGLNW